MERLELVTDFATLRVGMIVVHKGCGACGSKHRGILTKRDFGTVIRPGPLVTEQDRFWILPQPSAHPNGFVIAPTAVSARAVYRVIDGLENERSHSTSKKTNQPARVR